MNETGSVGNHTDDIKMDTLLNDKTININDLPQNCDGASAMASGICVGRISGSVDG
jgi:hypothetical protein